MLQKVTIGLVVVLVAAVGYLFYSNTKLQRQMEGMSGQPKSTNTISESNAVDPNASPFDQKHIDPLGENTDAAVAPDLTSIKYEQTQFDFGKINEGAKVKTQFAFTNTGNKPLLIAHAQGSCGCTVPEWPREPIAPGKSGIINVEFDSNGKRGEQLKTVTVTTNTDPQENMLYVKATVIPKDR